MTPWLDTIIIVGVIGFVIWLLTNLVLVLRAERARQTVEERSPLLIVVVAAVLAFVALAALTDTETARRLALFGVLALAAGEAVRRRVRR